ncbi:rhomboid family intramembrane serine protease, partial [archaeon]|nr:rhomboid family intramembrane serine protease [archaeon]
IDPSPADKIANVSRKFSVTNWLIIMNVVVYFIILFMGISGVRVENIFALQANAFFSGSYWTLLTSMFSHIWLPHLFFNLISLFFIGSFLEKIIGRKKFFLFYMVSGLFAGLFYVVLSFYFGNTEMGARIFVNPENYAVGASGAIFGLAGLIAVLTPKMKVYLIAGPIFALILQSILIAIFPDALFMNLVNLLVTVYIFISIFSIFSFNSGFRKLGMPLEMHFWLLPIVAIVPLVVIGLFVDLPIGNTAHLGGLIVGLVYGSYLRKRYKKKTKMISKMFGG